MKSQDITCHAVNIAEVCPRWTRNGAKRVLQQIIFKIRWYFSQMYTICHKWKNIFALSYCGNNRWGDIFDEYAKQADNFAGWYCLVFIVVEDKETFILYNQMLLISWRCKVYHNYVIKWKHFPRYWPIVRGIHQSRWNPRARPVTRSFDVFFYLRLNNGWVNNRETGDLRRHRAHYDVIVIVRASNTIISS